MMLIKVTEAGTVYPYLLEDLRADNPNVSFPKIPTYDTMALYGVFEVLPTPQPDYDEVTHKLVEETPNLESGDLGSLPVYKQVWSVVPCSAEEVEQNIEIYNRDQDGKRSHAYKTQSDPIFFKWQRGEATEQQWLDEVAKIKASYPDYKT